jgi:hypothetical protein
LNRESMVCISICPFVSAAKIEKICEFLLELSVRDIIKPDDREEMRILFHKLSEQKERLRICRKDKNLQPLPQTIKTIKKINNQIEKFTPRKKSLKDFIPLIELLISDFNNLLEPYIKGGRRPQPKKVLRTISPAKPKPVNPSTNQ